MGIEVLTTGIQKAANIELFKNLETYSNAAAWRRLCMFPPSTGAKTETYESLGDLPGMSEWLSGRIHKGLNKFKYTLENKDWESTVRFTRYELQDGVIFKAIQQKIPGLALSGAEHPMTLLVSLLVNGVTNLCLDGKAFFATDHISPVEGGTFSNKLTGTGVATVSAIRTDFSSAVTAFKSYRRRNGSLIFGSNLPKPVVLYDVTYDALFQEAFTWPNSATATLNPYFGQVDSLIAVPDMGNDWVLAIPGLPMSPFLFQEKKGIAPSDTSLGVGKGWEYKDIFETGEVSYGVDATYNMGYGLPQLAVMTANA